MRLALGTLLAIAMTVALCATAHAEISLTAPGLAPTPDDAPRATDGTIIEPEHTTPAEPDPYQVIYDIVSMPTFAPWEFTGRFSYGEWAPGDAADTHARLNFTVSVETDFIPYGGTPQAYPTLWRFGVGVMLDNDSSSSERASGGRTSRSYGGRLFVKLDPATRLFFESRVLAVPSVASDVHMRVAAVGARFAFGNALGTRYEVCVSIGRIMDSSVPGGLAGHAFDEELFRIVFSRMTTRIPPIAITRLHVGGETRLSFGFEITFPWGTYPLRGAC